MRESKAVGIIPARWGSTRFPGKPLHPIAGKPLLQRVWERALRAKELDAVIIATDDMRIAEAAFSWGAEIALTSSKHRTGTDRLAEVAAHAESWPLLLNIQGDEPMTDPRLIDRLVRALRAEPKLEMITAAHPFENADDVASSHQVKVVLDRESYALYFSRSAIPFVRCDGTPPRFLRHQGIYGYRRDLLLRFVKWKPASLERAESLEQLRALENGVRIKVIVTAGGSPGVDVPADVEVMERLLLTRRQNRVSRRQSHSA